MRYPPSFLDRLRSHCRLSELIARRIPIKRHGREFHALCPFHQEKSPSFTINDEKGFFHCFGCGAHGDAIGFIKDYERLEFKEAIEALAQELGIALPEFTPEQQKRAQVEQTLHTVLEEAKNWFARQLLAPAGRHALHYANARGLDAAAIAHFGLGYATDSREALKTHLLKLGMQEPLLKQAGLLIQPEQGTSYDRFRQRLIIPIYDAQGRVVAFGGRLLSAEKQDHAPKYLNSPETVLFKKGELLYHLHHARKPAREKNQILVMEGYMDVIACASAGLTQSVATLGTAVTPEHLRLLWGMCDEPVLCLDGDAAGARAMHRAALNALPLLAPGKGLRFLRLPAGDDPDSFIRRSGPEAFLNLAAHGATLADTLWHHAIQGVDLSRPEMRAGLEQQLTQLAEQIKDATVRSHFRQNFKDLLWQVAQSQRPSFGKGKPAKPAPPRSPALNQLGAGLQDAPQLFARALLLLPILAPELLADAQTETQLCALEFTQPSDRALRDALLECAASLSEHDSLKNQLFSQGHQRTIEHLLTEHTALSQKLAHPAPAAAALWQETMHSYHLALIERDYATAERELAGGDEAALPRFMALQAELRALRKNLAHGVTEG